ncbi:MAG: hypothetical protein ACKVS9_13800 [Phycisphaerae bacterium]
MDSDSKSAKLAGRLAVLAILLATFAAIALLVYVRMTMHDKLHEGDRQRAAVATSAAIADGESEAKARALVSSLVYSFLAFLVFLVGSFVMIRFGRMALARSSNRAATPYVDAWAQGRVTDEQIAEATRESDEQRPDGDKPAA